MEKQILIIKGSPRKKGNTAALADAFAKGAKESGNAVTEVILKEKTFAVEPFLKDKKIYLLSAGAAPEEQYMHTMIDSFRQYISCFRAGGNEEGGILFAYGTNAPSDVKEMPVMDEAYQMGKMV